MGKNQKSKLKGEKEVQIKAKKSGQYSQKEKSKG